MSKLIDSIKEVRLINKIEGKANKIKAINELREKIEQLREDELHSQKANMIKMIDNYGKNIKRGFDPIKKIIDELWESDKQ